MIDNMKKQDDLFKTQIRLPADLHDAIKDSAMDNGRSLNGEMITLLRIALGHKEPPLTISQLKEVLEFYHYNSNKIHQADTNEVDKKAKSHQTDINEVDKNGKKIHQIINDFLKEQEKRMYEIANEVLEKQSKSESK